MRAPSRAAPRPVLFFAALFGALLVGSASAGARENNGTTDRARAWSHEWPDTDFSRHSVPLNEIETSIAKDTIASIDHPRFLDIANVMIEDEDGRTHFPAVSGRYRRSMSDASSSLSLRDPVISLEINGDARAYPLRIMIYHEIINDIVGGRPVIITYCPLCNTAIVFDRTINGAPVEFGATGKLRHSDLVMYDRESFSWWQQFTGKAIVGEQTGHRLERLVARLESYESFTRRFPQGRVLTPDPRSRKPYGRNPYIRYDTARRPFLFRGETPAGIKPLARVVVVNDTAYALALLQDVRVIEEDGYRLSWRPGQASALDTEEIARGRDVGNVVVEKQSADGKWRDAPYEVTFAFAYHAFNPDGRWRK